MTEPRMLPPFPTDDFTLTQLEHALNTCICVDDDGTWRRVRSNGAGPNGGEFTMSQFLNFMSGYDPDRVTLIGYTDTIPGTRIHTDGAIPIYEAWDQRYSEHDVIRALVARIRELEAR